MLKVMAFILKSQALEEKKFSVFIFLFQTLSVVY